MIWGKHVNAIFQWLNYQTFILTENHRKPLKLLFCASHYSYWKMAGSCFVVKCMLKTLKLKANAKVEFMLSSNCCETNRDAKTWIMSCWHVNEHSALLYWNMQRMYLFNWMSRFSFHIFVQWKSQIKCVKCV